MGTSGISECYSLDANTLQKHRWFFNCKSTSEDWYSTHLYARSLLKSCHYSSSTIKAQTEIIGEKAEQLSVKSINKSTTHRSYRKNGFRNNRIPVNAVKSIPNRILTTAVSIHIYLGATTSFKCMLSYIWNHVDL